MDYFLVVMEFTLIAHIANDSYLFAVILGIVGVFVLWDSHNHFKYRTDIAVNSKI